MPSKLVPTIVSSRTSTARSTCLLAQFPHKMTQTENLFMCNGFRNLGRRAGRSDTTMSWQRVQLDCRPRAGRPRIVSCAFTQDKCEWSSHVASPEQRHFGFVDDARAGQEKCETDSSTWRLLHDAISALLMTLGQGRFGML